jgi:hypothetical protein
MGDGLLADGDGLAALPVEVKVDGQKELDGGGKDLVAKGPAGPARLAEGGDGRGDVGCALLGLGHSPESDDAPVGLILVEHLERASGHVDGLGILLEAKDGDKAAQGEELSPFRTWFLVTEQALGCARVLLGQVHVAYESPYPALIGGQFAIGADVLLG